MKKLLCTLAILAFSCAHAQEADEQPATPTLRELLQQAPQQTFVPKKKKVTQPPVKKGATYLLTYQGDDNQWYEAEAIATGRWASYCDGVRYEVETDEFLYFAKLKELRRIYSR